MNNVSNMKYLIITKYSQYQIEAKNFEDAFNQAYHHNRGYDDLIAIIKIETD